jgi:hypothetical protein
MRILLAVALILIVLVVLADGARSQVIEGPPTDCRVLMPHTGIDAHKATDYVEVTIVNTNMLYTPQPHPEGLVFERDFQKVLWRAKDRRFSNLGAVPVDVCEWDEKGKAANVWKAQ